MLFTFLTTFLQVSNLSHDGKINLDRDAVFVFIDVAIVKLIYRVNCNTQNKVNILCGSRHDSSS